MEINNKNVSIFSMLSEMHDNLSISVWLNRWLRCIVSSPKYIVSDQLNVLISRLVQAFTQYILLLRWKNI